MVWCKDKAKKKHSPKAQARRAMYLTATRLPSCETISGPVWYYLEEAGSVVVGEPQEHPSQDQVHHLERVLRFLVTGLEEPREQ